MRIVLLSSGEFPKGEREFILQWMNRFARQLQTTGADVQFFDPAKVKVEYGDIVHVFGFSRAENWYWLKGICSAVFLSPLPSPGPRREASLLPHPSVSRLAHRLRKLIRPRQTPLDRVSFLKAVDGFYVFAPYLLESAGLPVNPDRVDELPAEAVPAAQKMISVYQSGGASR